MPSPPQPERTAVRMFGSFRLVRLLGKSQRTMAWQAADADGSQRMLVLPRAQPASAAALQHWQAEVRRAGRLQHPQLAPMLAVGVQDGWPFVLHDLGHRMTLAERLPGKGLPGPEAAALAMQALEGLAYAHEAGVAHHDPHPWLLLVDDAGHLRCAGLGVGIPFDRGSHGDADVLDPSAIRVHRLAAERDVLALGVLLHNALGSGTALDEPDIGRVIERMPPLGREFVRLSWDGAHPIAEPLRAIVNRATDRQERQRYRNARTLIGALEGWLHTESASGGGVMALLGDRLRAGGALPSSPDVAARAARIAMSDGASTSELAEVVLEDVALSFELLRLVNSAQVRGVQVSGSGPVLTVRRAIAMIGLDGVRRAAGALRPWPGSLDEQGAAQLDALLVRSKRVARLAMALRPAGYDGEVVYLLALLQGLGRMVMQYQFPDEAQQIVRLMQPGPAARPGDPDEPGMSEEAAAFAVLGVDLEALGGAVARWWGLDSSVQAMIRRLPIGTSVRTPEHDDDMLRTVASCAHEAIEAANLPAQRALPALQRVAQRYGRVLGLALRDLQNLMQSGGEGPISQPGLTMPAPLDEPPPATSPAGARPAT